MFLLFFNKMFRGPPNKSSMSKTKFFLILLALVLSVILIGFLLPWLMSAKGTIPVLIALVVMLSIPVSALYYILFRNKKENSK